MSYFPIFSYFDKKPDMRKVAKICVPKFFKKFGYLNVQAGNPLKVIYFDDIKLFFDWLNSEKFAEFSFEMSNKFHGVFFYKSSNDDLIINLWDFNLELFKYGEIPDYLKIEKKELSLEINEVLVRDCGALVSYTSCFDAPFSGRPDLYEIADSTFSIMNCFRARKNKKGSDAALGSNRYNMRGNFFADL